MVALGSFQIAISIVLIELYRDGEIGHCLFILLAASKYVSSKEEVLRHIILTLLDRLVHICYRFLVHSKIAPDNRSTVEQLSIGITHFRRCIYLLQPRKNTLVHVLRSLSLPVHRERFMNQGDAFIKEGFHFILKHLPRGIEESNRCFILPGMHSEDSLAQFQIIIRVRRRLLLCLMCNRISESVVRNGICVLSETEVTIRSILIEERSEEITQSECLRHRGEVLNTFLILSLHQKDHAFSEETELLQHLSVSVQVLRTTQRVKSLVEVAFFDLYLS